MGKEWTVQADGAKLSTCKTDSGCSDACNHGVCLRVSESASAFLSTFSHHDHHPSRHGFAVSRIKFSRRSRSVPWQTRSNRRDRTTSSSGHVHGRKAGGKMFGSSKSPAYSRCSVVIASRRGRLDEVSSRTQISGQLKQTLPVANNRSINT